jgi:hypothetical protein
VRLPRSSTSIGPGATAQTDAAPPDGSLVHPLFGGWSATRWQYRSAAEPGRAVDVITDLTGTVTLSLTATAFILAADVPGRGKHSVSGACQVRDDELLLVPDGGDREERVRVRQAGDTLTLRSETSGWDFDGNGQDQAAAFVAVLVRL